MKYIWLLVIFIVFNLLFYFGQKRESFIRDNQEICNGKLGYWKQGIENGKAYKCFVPLDLKGEKND